MIKGHIVLKVRVLLILMLNLGIILMGRHYYKEHKYRKLVHVIHAYFYNSRKKNRKLKCTFNTKNLADILI